MVESGTTILLETARLRLRRFAPGDLGRLVELDSDPEVMRFITYGAPTPRATYEQLILPRWFAIYSRTPELGYRLARTAWGRGLATEGALAVIDHGFTRAGAGRIAARTLAANHRSRQVMLNCGLEFECDFVYPEDVVQGRGEAERAAVKYSTTLAKWLAQRA
jgi:RimJ/RimL family protein N-acetyltransferase